MPLFGRSMIAGGRRSRDRLLQQILLDRAAQLELRGDRQRQLHDGAVEQRRAGETPNGALTASTLGRMWYGALNVTLIAISLATKLGQRGSSKNGASCDSRALPAIAARHIGREHRRQIVVALLVSPQIAALAGVERVAGLFRAVAEQLGQQHRQVLRPAEARIAALAVQDHAGLAARLAKQQRVGHGERIADRIAQERDRLVEVLQNHGRRELHDVVVASGSARPRSELKGSSFGYSAPKETEYVSTSSS